MSGRWLQSRTKAVTRVRLERRFAHDLDPRRARRVERRGALPIAALDAARRRRIALEMIRVELRAYDRAASREANDRPVVSGASAPFRLPAVSHMRGAAGQDEVLSMAEEHVAANDHVTAVLHRRQIDTVTLERLRLETDFAVRPEARDTAIRIDIEPQMR